MKFIKGVMIGGLITTGLVMMYTESNIMNKKKMIIWCLKYNEPSKKFYKKMGGTVIKERLIEIGEKGYIEVGFIYNI